jgi:hypothetical protein
MPSPEEQMAHFDEVYPISKKRKAEIDDLAKFLFENRDEILSRNSEDARAWVDGNYQGGRK